MRKLGIRRVVTLVGIGLLLAAEPLSAQGQSAQVKGRVVAQGTAEPLASANVVLRRPGGDVVTGGATDAQGNFHLTGIQPGPYTFEVSYIGYAALRRELVLVPGASIDLGTIELASEVISLEGVTVQTERPPVVFAPDRDVYSLESLPGAAGGVATEMLSSIPDLEVDFDGTITLRGSTPRIYINGRPAPMEGEALAAFLEQFPADQIARVEVIPNPSARFDAEGSGGIINIVLKEGVDLGMNGSAFANLDTRGAMGGGGRVTWQRGRLTLNANGFLRRSDQETTGFDLRQNLLHDPPTKLRQDNWSERSGLSGNGRLNAEFKLGERTSLRAEGRFSDFGSDSERENTTTHMDHLDQWTQRYSRTSRVESTRRSLDGMVGFKHDFEPDRHTLEVEFRYGTGRNDEDEWVETEFELVGDDGAPVPADVMIQDTDDRARETTLQVDYVRPFGESVQLEVGYRGNFETRKNDRRLDETEQSPDGPNTVTTLRGFTYDETYHSGYVTLAGKLGPLGVQLGTRVRHGDTRFEVPTGDVFENSGVDFFPSANLTYEMGNGRRMRLSYTRRTRRPPPWNLNPIDESTDPLNRRVGNPNLEPQYTHSFGLDMSTSTSWGTLRLAPFYRRIVNDWARIRTVDENGVSTTTWENVATQEAYGASLTASIRQVKGWGGFVSLNARGEDRDASNLASTNISGRTFHWSIRGNVSGSVVGGLGVRASLSYTPARDVPQGRVSSRVDSSISFRQRLLDGRMTVSLTARDPFDISRTDFTSSDPTFVQLGQSRTSRRAVAISLNYNFGGPEGGNLRGGGPMRPGGPRR